MDDDKKRNRFLPVRISNHEMNAIQERFKKTACGSFSEFVRYALLERSIVTLYRNQSLDELMAELITARKELNAIGKNINLITRSIQSATHVRDKNYWLQQLQLECAAFTRARDKMQIQINKIADTWLPSSNQRKG